MIKRNILECMTLVGKAPSHYEGAKTYVSTGAVDCDHIDYKQTEQVTYDNRPSRANLSVTSGDILFAKMCGTKKTLRINDVMAKYLFSTGFCAVRANESVMIADLLYHLLSSEQFLTQKDQNSSGATQKAITNTGLKKITIQVPDLEEQRVLAAKLDCIEQMMAKRRIQIEYFDQLVKSRFIEMFGDVIRNSKAWQMRVFEDVAASRLGKMLDAKQQTGKYSYPYLANFNVQWFRFNIENLNQMDFDEDDRAEFELKDGDLLVCEGGEIGRCAVWHNEIQPCFFQKALHRVRCNRQIIHPDYLAWWFKYNCDYDGFTAIAGSKATIAHLPGIKLKQLQVAVPPIELQEQFATFVEQTDKSKLAIQESLKRLEILKKSLMQKYFG